MKDVMDYLEKGMLMQALSEVNIHEKNESLVKIINSYKDQQSRVIVWLHYWTAVVFSPVFMEAKDRLKQILKPWLKYIDGMTPDEIGQWLH